MAGGTMKCKITDDPNELSPMELEDMKYQRFYYEKLDERLANISSKKAHLEAVGDDLIQLLVLCFTDTIINFRPKSKDGAKRVFKGCLDEYAQKLEVLKENEYGRVIDELYENVVEKKRNG